MYEIGKTRAPLKEASYHRHPFGQIILNVSGTGTEKVDGEINPITAGSITVVPKETYHSKHAENGFEDIFTFFDEEALPVNACVRLRDDELGSVRHMMEALYGLYYLNDRVITESQRQLHRALTELLKEKMNALAADPEIERLRARIIDRFNDPELTVEQVMDGCAYCPDYARRRFKEIYGRSPQAYILDLRMEKAAAMLAGNGVSVADTALACGYYDQAYFARLFRKKWGTAPTDYRKKSEKS